jgi:hypothetical protein
MNTFRLTRITAELALAGLLLSGISGCAIMSEEECYATNWYEKGYQDGTQGKGSSILGEYVSACSKYVNVDRTGYNQGRREGAEVFCEPSRAFDLGIQGYTLTDICRGTRHESEFVSQYQAGHVIYDMGKQIEEIDKHLSEVSELMSSGAYRGDVYDRLRSDYRYLEQLRYHAENDYNKLRNANGRNVTVRNYRNEINRMPFPDALSDARVIRDNIAEADREIDRIRHDMDDIRRRMDKTSDDHLYHRLRKQWECLKNADHWVRRKLEESKHDYHPRRIDFSRERKHCSF